MNLPAEIAQLKHSAVVSQWLNTLQEQVASVAGIESQLVDKTAELKSKTEALAAADLKIQALMLELARYKRISFGRTSEAIGSQLSLFEEALHSDIAAVQEELTQTVRTLSSTDSAPRRGSSGRQTLRSIYLVLNIVMSLNPVCVMNAVRRL